MALWRTLRPIEGLVSYGGSRHFDLCAPTGSVRPGNEPRTKLTGI